jgi:hypothetical protein
MPNCDGKNQITTDMEIITSEILNHKVIGRFLERVQYLRRKTVVPIDAPKTTMRGKIKECLKMCVVQLIVMFKMFLCFHCGTRSQEQR